MAESLPWRPGDRVRTVGYVLGLPPGSMGTIEQVLPFGDIYDVRFDDLTESHFLQRRALELASSRLSEREVGTHRR
jgi:hypothetical protein